MFLNIYRDLSLTFRLIAFYSGTMFGWLLAYSFFNWIYLKPVLEKHGSKSDSSSFNNHVSNMVKSKTDGVNHFWFILSNFQVGKHHLDFEPIFQALWFVHSDILVKYQIRQYLFQPGLWNNINTNRLLLQNVWVCICI